MFARILLSATLAAVLIFQTAEVHVQDKSGVTPVSQGYAGSKSCIECHEKFYGLWSTSRHGLAMQPYNTEFAKTQLTPQQTELRIGKFMYQSDITKGVVYETGAKGTKQYKIAYALGGKNVYYFLTPFPRGRLQTLPVAYDVNKKEWFDMAASGIRHFPSGERGQAVNWREWSYTFNTACYSCHVSQLSTNYDTRTDTYKTTWAEPGINCESCHGPGEEHNRVFLAAPKDQPPKDSKLVTISQKRGWTAAQVNDTCSVCHLKGIAITAMYPPGESIWNHYDLVTLESPDYYPDGRDLGENFTYTSWLMSPCVRASKLDCLHCHTSSGRYRFRKEKDANNACMPCHKERVQDAAVHTNHPPGTPASKCISCHMPMTEFARMKRSDHSMLPPTPAVTLAYKSPNACNGCHTDKDAKWADMNVRKWRKRDYQAPVLYRTGLIDAARKRDWSKLPEILAYIQSKDRDEVFATSLIRLIMSSQDERITTVLLAAMRDPSPLVRGAACQAISLRPTRESVKALLEATGDEYRVVRVHAAAGLVGYPAERLTGEAKRKVENAMTEYLAFIMARPDQWMSHYNMGNYRLNRGELKDAVASYSSALRIEPEAVMAMVNLSLAYARMGENDSAEKSLQKALKTAPDNAAVNFNMGLLKAGKKDTKQAERYLKAALKYDPQMAQAAYNLCVITSKNRINEAVAWCRRASELRPQEPKYSYTLAFYLNQKGEKAEAIRVLKAIVDKHPGYTNAEMLLKEISR